MDKFPAEHLLKVHVVTVMERDCPEGDEPIAWYLVTNEPITTSEQVASVVDAYRARWVVEEFFKALKTGCQIEKRQMESYGVSTHCAGVVPSHRRTHARPTRRGTH
jgi:hypothetical protein